MKVTLDNCAKSYIFDDVETFKNKVFGDKDCYVNLTQSFVILDNQQEFFHIIKGERTIQNIVLRDDRLYLSKNGNEDELIVPERITIFVKEDIS